MERSDIMSYFRRSRHSERFSYSAENPEGEIPYFEKSFVVSVSGSGSISQFWPENFREIRQTYKKSFEKIVLAGKRDVWETRELIHSIAREI